MPRYVHNLKQAKSFVREHLALEYGIETASMLPLGGKYHPSAGSTPEVVHPFIADVSHESKGRRALLWTPLAELVPHAAKLRDGHLRVALFRAAHALGLHPATHFKRPSVHA
jgi:hypothetical protein